LTDYRRSVSTLREAEVGSGGTAPAPPAVYCTEAFDTADLKDAKALLDELGVGRALAIPSIASIGNLEKPLADEGWR
jgi:hypothetical protein